MVQTIGSRRVISARGRPQEASISLHSGEAFPARGKLGKRKVEERRDKKPSVSGMCNLVFVCILNIAMGDTSHKRSLDVVSQYYTPTLRALKYA